jgi:hypothetical protein
MKYKFKVIEPRFMSGQIINQEIIMFDENKLNVGDSIMIFGGRYKVLEVLR